MENTPISNTFQSLVDLPIAQIKENPDNPRHIITSEMTEAMAASLKAVGLKNPIKVRPIKGQIADSSRPDVNDVAPSPLAQTPAFELVSGHIRLAGAKILGWATIKALVKNLTPQEALLEAILDNRGQEMTWLDLYLSIEALMKADPEMTQKDAADRLEVTETTVSRALKVLKLLNTFSRQAILANCKNSGDEMVPEYVIRRLVDLEKSQHPHLQDLVQMALGVVIRQKMAEPQVARMVAAILKTGITPEAYESELLALKDRRSTKGVNPDDPNGGYWQNLPPNVQVKWTAQGYRVTMDLSPAEGPVGVYGAMAWLEHMKHKALGAHDPRYAKALPQLTEKNQKAYGEEQKAGVMNPAPTTAQSQAEAKPEIASAYVQTSADKPSNPLSAVALAKANHNVGLGTVEQPSITNQSTHVETPVGAATDSAPAAKTGGLGGLVMQAIKNRIGSNTEEVESNAANALVNDAQRAANSLVRQGMRKVFKDLI